MGRGGSRRRLGGRSGRVGWGGGVHVGRIGVVVVGGGVQVGRLGVLGGWGRGGTGSPYLPLPSL